MANAASWSGTESHDAVPDEVAPIAGYEPLQSSTIRGGSALVVGLLLLAIALGGTLVACVDLGPRVPRPNVPSAVMVACVVGVFGGPGLFLLVLGLHDTRAARRLADARRVHAGEPWRFDHGWRAEGTEDLGLRQALMGLVGWLLAVAILVPLHLVFLGEVRGGVPWLAALVLGLFDLLVAIGLATLLLGLFLRLIRGPARLRFGAFPLRLGERVELFLAPHPSFARAASIHCVLRCVEETNEARRVASTTQSGQTIEVRKVGREHARLEQTLPSEVLRMGGEARLVFALPTDPALRTRLSALPSRHWELLVQTGEGGLRRDRARFLVPVY
ncbi:MAG: hypothetical protein R3F35_20360 [Myxococcota bacterium]